MAGKTSPQAADGNGAGLAGGSIDHERKFQSLLEGLCGEYIIFSHAPDGTVTYVSPSVRNVLGFDPEPMIGMNWRDYIGENNYGRKDADEIDAEVARGKLFHKLVVEINHRDGEPKILEVQERPVFDAHGTYVSMEGIAKDITESTRVQDELRALRDDLEQRVAQRTRKLEQMNEQLRESESRYRDLVEKQGELIVRWGPEGRRRDMNEAYCRYLGCTRQELTNQPFLPAIVKEDRGIFEEAFATISPRNPTVTYEHRVQRGDGSIRWVQWTDTAFYNEHDVALEYLSVGRDVTELKQAQDRLREQESHLAHLSRLATMGELVAGIAHEVHQPLHAASTFAEAARRNLEMGDADGVATAIECTKEIADAIGRTAQIIRRLRDFTKPQPERMELLDLNAVVSEAVEIMAFATRRASVFPQLQLESRLPPARGDHIQLQQVCVNLIQNACDAVADLPASERRLIVQTFTRNNVVGVTFRDSGRGIDPDNANRLFDAFFTTKPDGMGMGLSLCKSIADAHGAQLTFRSNDDDQGATFELALPILGEPQ
ncbi:PAS domain S-box protein [Pirellulales bacterium]|nr:PAS domain S-box protein [Pirellulales bacterium]